jgi:uncharacterized membrane protein YkvI
MVFLRHNRQVFLDLPDLIPMFKILVPIHMSVVQIMKTIMLCSVLNTGPRLKVENFAQLENLAHLVSSGILAQPSELT